MQIIWAMIHFYLGQPKSIKKTLSRPLHSKLKKIQGLFKDWHSDLRTFQGKMELKDFSRLCEPWGHQTSQVKLNMVLYSAWVWFLATFKSKIVQISDLQRLASLFSVLTLSRNTLIWQKALWIGSASGLFMSS